MKNLTQKNITQRLEIKLQKLFDRENVVIPNDTWDQLGNNGATLFYSLKDEIEQKIPVLTDHIGSTRNRYD